jgi:hypothetical protein
MPGGKRYAERVGAQCFKFDPCDLLVVGLDHDGEFQRGIS